MKKRNNTCPLSVKKDDRDDFPSYSVANTLIEAEQQEQEQEQPLKTPEVALPTSISFQTELPYGVVNEIKIIKKQTEKDNKEKSLTMCELNNKLFIGGHAKGTLNGTMVLPCHKKYGKDARQIGDIHTHPFNDKETMGLTPSETDFIGNVNQSFSSSIPQVSCIISAGKKKFMKKGNMVHCFQPKEELVNNSEKVKQYNKAFNKSANMGNDVHPFLRENIGKDFYHIWYKNNIAITKDQEKNPEIEKEILDEMFGQSAKQLKLHGINDFEKTSFCQLMQDYNMPDNDDIAKMCRNKLETKELFGYKY